MWGLVKGVKIGLRFALRGLVFKIEAILDSTFTTKYSFLPLIFNSQVSSVGKSSGLIPG